MVAEGTGLSGQIRQRTRAFLLPQNVGPMRTSLVMVEAGLRWSVLFRLSRFPARVAVR